MEYYDPTREEDANEPLYAMEMELPRVEWVAPEGCRCRDVDRQSIEGDTITAKCFNHFGSLNQKPWCYVHEDSQCAPWIIQSQYNLELQWVVCGRKAEKPGVYQPIDDNGFCLHEGNGSGGAWMGEDYSSLQPDRQTCEDIYLANIGCRA
eukprot:UN27464